MSVAQTVPGETSTGSSDKLVTCLTRDIRQGDNFTYFNQGRECRGVIDRIDTHDNGSVGVVFDVTGGAVCRLDCSTVVTCCEEDTIVLKTGFLSTLVVNPHEAIISAY